MKKIITYLLIFNSVTYYSQSNLIDTSIIAYFDSAHNYYKIKEILQISPSEIVNIGNPNALKVNSTIRFIKAKTDTDAVNNTHHRYNQTYQNIPIEGSQLKIHCNQLNNVSSINGVIANISDVSVSPMFSINTAIDFAKNNFENTVFAWEDTLSERIIKRIKNDSTVTNYPICNLVMFKASTNYQLAYKVTVNTAIPFGKWLVFIDANTGILLKKANLLKSCFNLPHNSISNSKIKSFDVSSCSGSCIVGTANTLYYGSQYISTGKYSHFGCKYRLKEDCNTMVINTRDYASGAINEITDNTNNWTFAVTQPGVTAHWCAEMTCDYYRNSLGRYSFDNNNALLDVMTNGNLDGVDYAGWYLGQIYVGTGGGSKTSNDYATLDIIGHEFTHGVNDYSANLTYENEYGALDESFADIFGTMVEFYAKSNYSAGGVGNYLLGEDIYIAGALRNLANPKQYNQPDTYGSGGTYWADPNPPGGFTNINDYGGVHTNSGIQNFWFYLLAEGSSSTDGINDNGNSYCVSPIGRDKAANIAYHTLTTYLNTNSKYIDARFYSIQSAIDLYGANSNEVAQVTAAWYAVGVGSQFNGQVDVKNIVLNAPKSYHYNAKIALQNLITNAPAGLIVTSNTEIELLSEISFNSGSENELYITPACLGGARIGNPNTTSDENTNSYLIENNSSVKDFVIMPNPTTGIFKLRANSNLEYPKQITIHNILGQTILNIENLNSFEYELNLLNKY
jgi:Zn-dependent metalloprotease